MGEEFPVAEIAQPQRKDAYPEAIHQKLTDLLKLFLYLSSMPEVVEGYLRHEDIAAVGPL